MRFCLSTILVFCWLFPVGELRAEKRLAEAGTLDLSDWDFAGQGAVDLRGDWLFYPAQLASPNELQGVEEAAHFWVPRLWNGQILRGKELPGDGFATYRLIVRMPAEGERILSLAIKDLPTAYRLWINGQEMLSFGQVATEKTKSRPAVGPRVVSFVHTGGDLDLVLQVSSFFHRAGGTWHPPRLGLSKDHHRKVLQEVALDMLVVSCVLVMALYHFVIAWLRRESYAALTLAIYCSIIAVRVGVAGDGALALRFFDLGFDWYRRLELLSFYSAIPCFMVFLHFTFPRIVPKKLIFNICYLCAPFILAPLLLPSRWFSETIPWFQVLAIGAIAIFVYFTFRAWLAKEDGSFLFFLGGLTLTGASMNDILAARQIIETPNVTGLGFYSFIFFQSAVVAKIYSRAFDALNSSQETIKELNSELQIHIEHLDQLVEQKTREVRSIMAHIPQGICMIEGSQLSIVGEYSSHLEELTGQSRLEGRSLLDLMFTGSDVNDLQRAQLEQALTCAWNQESFTFEVNRHLLVTEFRRVKAEGSSEIFEVDWNAIENDQGLIERYLVSVRNVTQLRYLQEVALKNQEEWAIVQDLIQIPSQKLPDVMRNMTAMLNEVTELIRKHPELSDIASRASVDEDELLEMEFLIFRLLHTMKGNADSFGMTSFANSLHEAEACWSPRRRLASGEASMNARWQGILKLRTQLEQYQQVMEEKLFHGQEIHEKGVFLPWASLKSMVQQMSSWAKLLRLNRPVEARQQLMEELPKVVESLVELSFQSIGVMAEEIVESLRVKAQSLDKELPRIIIEDHGIFFDPEEHQLVHSLLTQLIRNTLGHGLESRAARIKAGKPPRGTIQISLTNHNHESIELSFEDDGQGFHLPTIRNRGIQNGLISESEQDRDVILNLIFYPDFSTKEKVTDLAGRGIGLDAVRYMLEKRDGQINIEVLEELPNGYLRCRLVMLIKLEVWQASSFKAVS